MTKDEEKQIVALAIEQFIDCQRAAHKKKRNRWLHNTKQLMKHYNTLNAHSRKSVATLKRAFAIEDIFETEASGDINIVSIKKSAATTHIIIQHVNQMLTTLKNNYEQTGRGRKWRIFEQHFMQQKTFREIADTESIDERTAYRDTDDVLETLSILLFGIEELIKI